MDGFSKIGDVSAQAAAMGHDALAITDHGTLAGAWRFHEACKKNGIKPILGIEAYLAIGSRFEKNTEMVDRDDETSEGEKEKRYEHLTLIAYNHTGWLNLIKLHDASHDSYWYKPRMDYDLLAQHSEGLICLTGCLAGPIAGPLVRARRAPKEADVLPKAMEAVDSARTRVDEDPDDENARTALTEAIAARERTMSTTQEALLHRAKTALTRLITIFGRERVFVELMEHSIPTETQTTPYIARFAELMGVECVATNDSHYCQAHDASHHDQWLAVTTARDETKAKNRFRFNGEGYWLRSEEEMRALRPEGWWARACDNTQKVADMVDEEVLTEPSFRLPTFPVPQGTTVDEYLENLVREGMYAKYGDTPDSNVRARLDRELKVITSMGLSSYFLIVHDFISWARSSVSIDGQRTKKPIRIGPGRGSAAGCCVSYCLDITRVEPLRHNLSFERFLDPTRVGMPDIDIDIEKSRLSEAHAYMAHRWGEAYTARIGAYQNTKLKNALLDGGRLVGIASTKMNKLTATIPTVEGTFPTIAQLQDESFAPGAQFRKEIATFPAHARQEILGIAASFSDVVRGESKHASGLLVSDVPLDTVVPTRKDRDDETAPRITVWDGKDCESQGLLKLDLLGLRTMDVITKTLDNIEALEGVRPSIPDPDTPNNAMVAQAFDLISRGDTAGVFQLESASASTMCQDVNPRTWDDLTAINALNRPGPIHAGMGDRFANRRNGRELVTYTDLTTDPELQGELARLLDRTMGLVPYQETAMMLGVEVAGFGPVLTNRLRKAISKKIKEEFEVLGDAFVSGAMSKVNEDGHPKRAWPEKTARKLWFQIEGSAQYSFNASHSAAYSLVSFETAYLKAHWPAQFGAALLALTTADDRRRPALDSLASAGIEVCPPDINSAGVDTSAPTKSQVMIGLSEIKGVGVVVAEKIVDERDKGGPFTCAGDVARRVEGLNSAALTALAEAGAFDSFGPRLGHAMIARALGKKPDTSVMAFEWPPVERYRRQLTRLGFPVGKTPLSSLKNEIAQACSLSEGRQVQNLRQATVAPQGQRLDVLAVITKWDAKVRRSGKRTCQASLSNDTLTVDAWVWSRELSYMEADSIGLGSVVRATVLPRVREVSVEDEEGNASIQEIRELTIESATPIEPCDARHLMVPHTLTV